MAKPSIDGARQLAWRFSSAALKKGGESGAESYSVIGIYRYDEHPHSDVALISVGHYLAATSETSIRLDSLIDPPFFSHYSSSAFIQGLYLECPTRFHSPSKPIRDQG